MHATLDWMSMIGNVMLGVIMIARLHAMYQRSRKMLVFLVVIFLPINIYDGVMTALAARFVSGEELVLSDTYQCSLNYKGDGVLCVYHHLDTQYCVGSSYTVSRNPDCCKTLP